MDFITLFQQLLGHVGAVLTGNTGNKGTFRLRHNFLQAGVLQGDLISGKVYRLRQVSFNARTIFKVHSTLSSAALLSEGRWSGPFALIRALKS